MNVRTPLLEDLLEFVSMSLQPLPSSRQLDLDVGLPPRKMPPSVMIDRPLRRISSCPTHTASPPRLPDLQSIQCAKHAVPLMENLDHPQVNCGLQSPVGVVNQRAESTPRCSVAVRCRRLHHPLQSLLAALVAALHSRQRSDRNRSASRPSPSLQIISQQ
jgi:hypothetical protein